MKPFRIDLIAGLLTVVGGMTCAAYYNAIAANTVLIFGSLFIALVGVAVTAIAITTFRYSNNAIASRLRSQRS